MVKTFRIADRLVKLIHMVILSFAALIGLFVLPPVGIVLMLYLRGIFRSTAFED